MEFSTRNGARLRYWFSLSSKLLVKIEDDARQITTSFSEYRPQADDGKCASAASVQLAALRGAGPLIFLLSASLTTGTRRRCF